MAQDTAEAEGKRGKVDVDERQGGSEEVRALFVGGEDEGGEMGLEEGERGGRR